MSVTDAVSASTSWTEQTRGEFLAGSLSSIVDCRTEVESKLRRGTLSATSTPKISDVDRWLARAKQELLQFYNPTFKRRYVTATLTNNTYRYFMPPDYSGGYVMIRDTTNDRALRFVAPHIFDMKFADPTEEASDEPIVYTIKNMELWLIPPAGGSYVIEMDYDRSGADNRTEDFDYLPEIERFRCCDFAAYQSFLALHQWQEATLYKAEWFDNLKLAKKNNSKKAWSRSGFQAISFIQEEWARGRPRRLRKY